MTRNPRPSSARRACALALVASATAAAADNFFVPSGINTWNVPLNWSLMHVPLANEHVHVEADGFIKAVTYDWNGTSDFASLRIDGDGGWLAKVYQPAWTLTTDDLFLAANGNAEYELAATGYLWVDNVLYVGYQGGDPASFILATVDNWSAGLYTSDLTFVGYYGPGTFDHRTGYADIGRLYVGQGDPGTYHMRGTSLTESILRLNGQFVVGNGGVGEFEHLGGHVQQTTMNGLLLGLNTGGDGTYLMKGGQLDVDHVSIGFNGEGAFQQTGGVVNVADHVSVGASGTHLLRAMVTVSDDDDEPVLAIGGDLRIGPFTLAGYDQLGSGTVTVAGAIEIWRGTTDPYDSSYLHMGPNADWLGASEVLNHSGVIHLEGGTLNAPSLVNDSDLGVILDDGIDARIDAFQHNAGKVFLYRNALLRGTHAGGGVYNPCAFTNDAEVQMGTSGLNGGTFRGDFLNRGVFDYYQGDFGASSLVNEGLVALHGDFACARILNLGALEFPVGRWVTASGDGWSYALRNGGVLTMRPNSVLIAGAGKAVINDGIVYAGAPGADRATIDGRFENNGFLLPCDSSLDAGELLVKDDFVAQAGAELRIRLHGTTASDCDRLVVQDAAQLAGELDVRLTLGFVPAIGDVFNLVEYGSRTGWFMPIHLPALPADRAWDLDYTADAAVLRVVEADACPADLDDNGFVGFSDLLLVLGNWGGDPASVPGDADGSWSIDFADLLAILSAWGPCP